jgi:hypothetical protein
MSVVNSICKSIKNNHEDWELTECGWRFSNNKTGCVLLLNAVTDSGINKIEKPHKLELEWIEKFWINRSIEAWKRKSIKDRFNK